MSNKTKVTGNYKKGFLARRKMTAREAVMVGIDSTATKVSPQQIGRCFFYFDLDGNAWIEARGAVANGLTEDVMLALIFTR